MPHRQIGHSTHTITKVATSCVNNRVLIDIKEEGVLNVLKDVENEELHVNPNQPLWSLRKRL